MRGGAASEVPNLEEGGAGQRESRQADCHTVLPGVRLLVGLRIRAKRFAMTNLYCHPERSEGSICAIKIAVSSHYGNNVQLKNHCGIARSNLHPSGYQKDHHTDIRGIKH